MPELPEVETVVRQVRPAITGAVVQRLALHGAHVLHHKSLPVRALRGQKVCAVERRGKFIRIRFSGNMALLVHLRMTGHLAAVPADTSPGKHDHADLIFNNGMALRFRDVRKFGRLMLIDDTQADSQTPLADLGPEPLEISLEDFRRLLGSTSRGIKALLLDQHKLAGMGNIYCDEALFIARVHPATAANRISAPKVQALWEAMRQVLLAAIEHKGSSIDSFLTPEGEPGNYQNAHLAYGRSGQPCPRCGRTMRKTTVAGRGTTACPTCQRPPRRKSP